MCCVSLSVCVCDIMQVLQNADGVSEEEGGLVRPYRVSGGLGGVALQRGVVASLRRTARSEERREKYFMREAVEGFAE